LTDADHTGLDLDQVLGILRRRWRWIALSLVLVTFAAFGFSEAQTRKYTATASLVFNSDQQSQQVAGLPATSPSNQQAQQNTNLKLVELGDMAAVTARRLGHGLTSDEVKGDLSINAQGESNIVTIAATATSPKLAAAIANAYGEQFVSEEQGANHQYYASALALVNRQLAALPPKQRVGAAGLALQDRAQSLAVLAELRSGNVQLAQAATVPGSPSSPRVKRDTILGMLLGLMLGLGLAFLLERLDRRIREPKDLERIYGLPLLGVVPESEALSNGAVAGLPGGELLPDAETEVFQLIRAHLRYFNVDRRLRTLVIASAAPGDGKTTVARHLAAATAVMGARVLLVEADLRRPTLAAQMHIRSGPGLAEMLIDGGALAEATQTIQMEPSSSREADERALDVLVAGWGLPPNPAEMIESNAMSRVLSEARSAYDMVIIDTPPLTAVSDAFPLLSKVDGIIIVGRVGRNRRDVAQRLHETLAEVSAPLLGVIANGFQAGRLGPYAYGYYGTDEPPPATRQMPSTDVAGPAQPKPRFATRNTSSDGGDSDSDAASANGAGSAPGGGRSKRAGSRSAGSPRADSAKRSASPAGRAAGADAPKRAGSRAARSPS
jgi:succinoglycan biosynthesis transport protein ExoP